jgi:hypothetical protein
MGQADEIFEALTHTWRSFRRAGMPAPHLGEGNSGRLFKTGERGWAFLQHAQHPEMRGPSEGERFS